jgi:Xaa-Pro aminopeptidase
VQDVRALIDDMRLIKDAHELGIMRRAARIAAQAHRRAMQRTRAGRTEYEIEAELLYEFRRNGAQFPAYSPIVAGGANACVLHYVFNDAPLHDGDLLLIDAGWRARRLRFRHHAHLSGERALQRRAARGSTKSCSPRSARRWMWFGWQGWNEPHDAAVKVLAQGVIDLKLVPGSLDEVLEKETYKRFYMHRTGHWLGLDVHDAGEYKRQGDWRALARDDAHRRAGPVHPRGGRYPRAPAQHRHPHRGRRAGHRRRLRGDHRGSAESGRRHRSADARCPRPGLMS